MINNAISYNWLIFCIIFSTKFISSFSCAHEAVSLENFEFSPNYGPLVSYEFPRNVQLDSYSQMIQSDRSFRLKFSSFGKEFNIHLKPNENLFHVNARVNVFGHGGKLISSRSLSNTDVFKGRVLSKSNSEELMKNGPFSKHWAPFADGLESDLGWARFSIYSTYGSEHGAIPDFEGVFTDSDGQLYQIKTIESYIKSKRKEDVEIDLDLASSLHSRSIIFRIADFKPSSSGASDNITNHYCGLDQHRFNLQDAHQHYLDRKEVASEDKRKFGKLVKRSSAGCPTALKILYMGVAADCSYVSVYGGEEDALKQIISDWNQASNVYETTFNIALGIAEVNIQTTCDTSGGKSWNRVCSSSYNIANRLSDFSRWRGAQNDQLGLWHLMTECASGSTVGIAWLNMVCQRSATTQNELGGTSYVSGTAVSSASPNEWLVVAHEIGHNFGAIHDCTSRNCASCSGSSCNCAQCDGCSCNSQFIMNPEADIKGDAFSPPSIRTICEKNPILATCLEDPGSRTTITGNQCGNGVKEPGEECDCGPEDDRDPECVKCCIASECKLKPEAKCSDSNDECCQECQPKPAGTVCRSPRGVCDIEEKCDGNSGICPKDKFLPDLKECTMEKTNSPGKCASGLCTTRDEQCRIRGSMASITGECSQFINECTMICQAQGGGCIQISGFYIDGTSCGGIDGKCNKGACEQSFFSWVIGAARGNIALAIVIGMAIIIFVWLILSRLWICFCGSRRNTAVPRSRAPSSQEDLYPPEDDYEDPVPVYSQRHSSYNPGNSVYYGNNPRNSSYPAARVYSEPPRA